MFPKILICVVFVCFLGPNTDSKQVAGYYRSWSMYKSCKIENLNPHLSSILIYAFASFDSSGTIQVLDYNGGYVKFNALKKRNANLKTLLSIGGGKEGSKKFSLLAESNSSRSTFIKSSLEYIKTYGFDGIDIDWEYPALLGGRPEDKEYFVKFLHEVRAEFDKHGYILTAAVGISDSIIEKAYNVPEISKAVHYINLMTYNMHYYKDGRTGANAPLFSDDRLNVKYCTDAWISRGADPKKLLLGVATYGKTYTLKDAEKNGIGDLVIGPGLPGPRSKSAGTLTYDEILEYEHAGWTKKWSEKQQVPYLYHDDQWIGYDDSESISRKVKFANQTNLGGIMMWSVDMDDPQGYFGSPFPLLTTIKKCVRF